MRHKQLGLTTVGIILLIVLVMLLLGVLPVWPHTAAFGYWPGGIVGVLLIVLLVLLVAGRL